MVKRSTESKRETRELANWVVVLRDNRSNSKKDGKKKHRVKDGNKRIGEFGI
jgi:hypothetical protein